MPNTATWPICRTCGTQFPTPRTTCPICDDARQYVPRTGQSFTTLAALRAEGHRNTFTSYPSGTPLSDADVIFIQTTPKLAIGQRAALIRTGLPGSAAAGGIARPRLNILWDCLTLLDDETVQTLTDLGGVDAVVISHPHYYTTHAEWARAFGCPVYIAAEDEEWCRDMPCPSRVAWGAPDTEGANSSSGAGADGGSGVEETELEIVAGSGVRAIKLGGHFPGSMVLLYDGRLFIADTLVTTPSGLGDWSVDGAGQPRDTRPPGLNTFAFLWSIPNMIPLSADELGRMWRVLGRYEFRATHGAFAGMDIEDAGVKGRVLESMQIQARAMGAGGHDICKATV